MVCLRYAIVNTLRKADDNDDDDDDDDDDNNNNNMIFIEIILCNKPILKI